MGNTMIPFVMHSLYSDPNFNKLFEDIHKDLFQFICEKCKGNTLTASEIVDSKLNDKYCLTFDDGHISDYDIAMPLLIDNSCRATFFVVSDNVNKNKFLSAKNIREMHKFGMEIGSHSVSHKEMTMLNDGDAFRELNNSKSAIEDILGCKVNSFSFPYGRYDERLRKIASQVGYDFIFNSKHGVIDKQMLIYPRNSINSYSSIQELLLLLNPTASILLKWEIEDLFKKLFKNILKDSQYRSFRKWFLDKTKL